jgi:hypothetical protein
MGWEWEAVWHVVFTISAAWGMHCSWQCLTALTVSLTNAFFCRRAVATGEVYDGSRNFKFTVGQEEASINTGLLPGFLFTRLCCPTCLPCVVRLYHPWHRSAPPVAASCASAYEPLCLAHTAAASEAAVVTSP